MDLEEECKNKKSETVGIFIEKFITKCTSEQRDIAWVISLNIFW